ncbi:MAG TPA: hypothetical protein VM140_06650 [Burkholderiales bacterium]|nr:hypothetical protein [Burkholderiales bacterium]
MKNLLLALTLMTSTLALAAEPLGMVIDVQGNATLGKKPVEMLSYLNAGNEIQLSTGASMTVTWYAGSKEFKYAGPARLKVEAGGIKVVQGGAAQERAVADEKVAATKKLPPRLGQAAINMRSLKPMTPEQEAAREKLRPADNAPFGDWVVYAMGLEQVGLTAEAKGIWKKLSAQRPNDPKLRQLAE